MFRRLTTALYWCVFALALGLASLLVTWQALATVDFAYPVWYDVLGIDRTIEQYAPRNRYREGFARTTEAERIRLFGAIVDAIHNDGRGLAELRYHAPNGRVLGRLLRPPEIVHLRDVAALIEAFQITGVVAFGVLLLLVAEARWRRRIPPPMRRFAQGGALLAAAAAVVLLVVGPVDVFYALHRWVFPPDHQWFFYYEESLMSTMMQAPNLFGAIAALWFVLAALVAGGALWGLQRWLTRTGRARAR